MVFFLHFIINSLFFSLLSLHFSFFLPAARRLRRPSARRIVIFPAAAHIVGRERVFCPAMQTEAKAVENRKSLVRVPVGKTARVARLDTDESIRARLLDMGFTRGAAATCLFESPGGDPRPI